MISYAALRAGSGLQWGGERLYADGGFAAAPGVAETFGKDLHSGEPLTEEQYRALNPDGKAILKRCDYVAPEEPPSADYPLHLDTGRTVYHFHTRTKTARVPELQAAAPDVWVELSAADAARLGLAEGDVAEVRSPRGSMRGPVRITGVREGVVFVPFHYGWWDRPDGPPRAANELTRSAWDPASKQPELKTGAVAVRKIG